MARARDESSPDWYMTQTPRIDQCHGNLISAEGEPNPFIRYFRQIVIARPNKVITKLPKYYTCPYERLSVDVGKIDRFMSPA